jgi:hypothetical protein
MLRREDFLKKYSDSGVSVDEIDQKWINYNKKINEDLFLYGSGKSSGVLPSSSNPSNPKNVYTASRIDLGTTQNLSYRDIHYANGVWIMVCQFLSNNNIWRSTDGINWTRITYPGIASTFTTVRFANNRWVITGNQGSSRSAYSDDNGVNWVSQAAGGGQRYGLAYGNGIWVASKITGNDSRIDTNLTGLNTDWITRSTSPSMNKNWLHVNYGGGTFVSVADGGTDCVIYSDDGISWTQLNNLPFSGANCLPAWNGSYFLMGVGLNGNVATSKNGRDWTMYQPDIRRAWYKMIWNGEFFIAVASNHIDISYDGLKWTNIYTSPSNFFLYSVATDGNKIVTCNYLGGENPLVVLTPN